MAELKRLKAVFMFKFSRSQNERQVLFSSMSCYYAKNDVSKKVRRRRYDLRFVRSSRLQIFFKIGVLKDFLNFTGNHLCWSLFLTKFKAGSNTGVFRRDFLNF